MCKKIMDPSLEIAMKRYVRDYMPRIYKWLSVCLTPRDVTYQFINIITSKCQERKICLIYLLHFSFIKVTAYFMRIVKEIITHREMDNIRRNDIMQALIDLRYKETKMKDAQSQNVTSESNDIGIRSHFSCLTFSVFCIILYTYIYLELNIIKLYLLNYII